MGLSGKSILAKGYYALVFLLLLMGLAVSIATTNIKPASAVTLTPSWQVSQITPIGAENLTSISCLASVSTCYAVGNTENATPSVYVTTNTGSSWSIVTTNNLLSKHVILSSIDCISVTDCEVLGTASQNPNSGTPMAFYFNGSVFLAQALPSGIGTVGNLSCVSSTFCQATGATASGGAAMLLYDGSAWIQETIPSQIQFINDVSCSSKTFCLAIGDTLNQNGGLGSAEAIFFNGNSWNNVTAPSNLTVLDNVSCSGIFCVVFGTGSSQSNLQAYEFGGQSFQSMSMPSGFSGSISAVNCTSSTFCQAVGPNSSGTGSIALGYSGSGWVLETLANASSRFNAIDCFLVSDCIAIGSASDAYLNATWVPQTLVPFDQNLNDVSCVSSSFCVAGSQYYQGTYFTGGIYTYNGTSWSNQISPNGDQVGPISCLSTTFCMAVGMTNSLTNPVTVAIMFNGSTWAQQATIGSIVINDISCVSSTFCVGVGLNNGAAAVAVFNGSSWNVQQIISGSGDLTGISCTATNFCQAVGYSANSNQVASLDFSFDGSSWTQTSISGVSGQVLNSISCVGITFCSAVGQVTAIFNGTSWMVSGLPSSITYIDQVTCVAATFCQGLGFSTAQNSSQEVIVGAVGTPCQLICPLTTIPWSIMFSSSDPTLDYFSISCATVSFCIATGGTDSFSVILTYAVAAPVVSSVVLSSGPIMGGSQVTINGTGFVAVSAVDFGSTAATSYTVMSSTQIIAVTPIGVGTVNVTVTSNGMTSAVSVGDQYTYEQTVYNPVSPTRICDTRSPNPPYVNYNQCNMFGPGVLGAQSSLDVKVTGIHAGLAIPSNATSVVLNVTATNTTQAGGFLTVYPTGSSIPNTSSINFTAGQSVPNLVQVGIGLNGQVSVYNFNGSTDVIVDVEGYFAPTTVASNAGGYVPISPVRVCDTRSVQPGGAVNQCDNNGSGNTQGPNSILNVNVAGSGPGGTLDSVPSSAIAVVLNVTATNTTQAGGFLTVFPTSTQIPNASNLNFGPNESVANRVVVPIDPTTGDISIYNFNGNTDILVDVNGYYTGATSTTAGNSFTPIVPFRLCDTRPVNSPTVNANECNNGATSNNGPLTQAETYTMQVANVPPIPSNATAVVINVTSVNATSNGGFFTIFPTPVVAGGSPPNISDLNFNQGQIVANLDIVKIGSSSAIDIYNAVGSSDVIVDVMGFYS